MATDTGRTIDVTPAWAGILPALLAVIQNGETFESRRDAERELRTMAKAADRYNELARAVEKLRDAWLERVPLTIESIVGEFTELNDLMLKYGKE